LIYNNTVFVGAAQDLPLLLFTEWNGGNADGVYFYNNLFLVEGKVRYEFGESRDTVFDHNVFWGNHQAPPKDAHALTNSPPLLAAGSGGFGFDSLKGYRAKQGETLPRGRAVKQNGGQDFFGVPIPRDEPLCIGAAEQSD
jgi:hypothetical protein